MIISEFSENGRILCIYICILYNSKVTGQSRNHILSCPVIINYERKQNDVLPREYRFSEVTHQIGIAAFRTFTDDFIRVINPAFLSLCIFTFQIVMIIVNS